MRPHGIVETALFVADPSSSAEFYSETLQLDNLHGDERGSVMKVTDNQVLLLVKHGAAREPNVTSGGTIPPCDATGSMHVTFAVTSDEIEAWINRLETRNLEVSVVDWPHAGRSVYFRDPDGHLIELVDDVRSLWNL